MSGIFHYTSNEGAIGIINTACLFATHYRYLNDVRELSHATDIIVPVFEREFREVGMRLIAEGRMNSRLLTEYGERGFGIDALKLAEVGIRVTDATTPVFLTSFCRHEAESEHARDGLLSQWRGYGASGGCALEFSEEGLRELISEERDRFAYTHFSLSEILYENHAQALDMTFIEGIAEAFMRHKAGDPAFPQDLVEERIHGLYRTIAVVSPRMKSPAFHEEREVRIIAPMMRPEAAAEYPDRIQRKVHMRFRNGAPIPFIKLFEGVPSLPIKRVIVGPQRDQEKVAYALELALEARGVSVEVTRSQISYLP